MKLAARLYNPNCRAYRRLGQWESVTGGPLPHNVAGVPVPTTIAQLEALSDRQLTILLHRVELLAHDPISGVPFHRYEKLALLLAHCCVHPQDCHEIFTVAPDDPAPSTEPTITRAEVVNFNPYGGVLLN